MYLHKNLPIAYKIQINISNNSFKVQAREEKE